MLVSIFAVLLLSAQSVPQATPNGSQSQPLVTTTNVDAASSDGESPPGRNAAAPQVRCERVQVTGSNRYRRVCQTEEAREMAQDRAQRLMSTVMDGRPTQEGETEDGSGRVY